MRACPAGNGKGACALCIARVSNIRLRPSPLINIGATPGWMWCVVSEQGTSMTRNLIAALALIALTAAQPGATAVPKKAAPKAPSPACAKLATTYENFSKQLSMDKADGRGGSTAIMSEATLTLELMRANSCTLPTETPSDMRYILKAYKCGNAQRRAVLAAMQGAPAVDAAQACDWSTWTPDL